MNNRYFYRFREQDGSWSPWAECSRRRYEELQDSDGAEVDVR